MFYARDYSGSTHHDRGYFLHGACGEEVVGSQESKKIFDVFIQGEKFYFVLNALQVTCSGPGVLASIGAITVSLGWNFICSSMIGVGKAGEFSGRKEGINISDYSFPNMSLNRSYRTRVHVIKRVKRCYRDKNSGKSVGKSMVSNNHAFSFQHYEQ